MKRNATKSNVNIEQFAQPGVETTFQNLSDAESQTIQGGVLIALLLPAVQSAR